MTATKGRGPAWAEKFVAYFDGLSFGALPCAKGRRWLRSLPAKTSARQAWKFCPRGEWLLWVLSEAGVPLWSHNDQAVRTSFLHLGSPGDAVSADLVRKYFPKPPTAKQVMGFGL